MTRLDRRLLGRTGVSLALLSLASTFVGCSGPSGPQQPSKPASQVASPAAPSPSPNVRPVGVSLRDDLAFFDNALTFVDHGSFGLDRGIVLPATEGAPGPVLRVTYPAGSASKRGRSADAPSLALVPRSFPR